MPAKVAREALYQAIEAFVTTMPDGEILSVKKGELFSADHRLLQHEGRRKTLFRLTNMTRPEVEKATDAPGEKRGEVA